MESSEGFALGLKVRHRKGFPTGLTFLECNCAQQTRLVTERLSNHVGDAHFVKIEDQGAAAANLIFLPLVF